MVVEIKFAFSERKRGLFTVAKECNLYEFQMKKDKTDLESSKSVFYLEITLDQGPIFQLGLQSTT